MPTKSTTRKAKQDLRQGKSPTTAAGEFVHEEIDHVREGKHGARSTKQAIAIGLSKARRAGVPLKAPAKGKATTRKSAKAAYEVGPGKRKARSPSRARSAARPGVLRPQPKRTGSRRAVAGQATSPRRGRGRAASGRGR